jgi:UDP-glucose 4-epimerase
MMPSMLEAFENVAVTGGSGFIGRHLVESLLSLGKEVTVIDRAARDPGELPSEAEHRAADIRKLEEIGEALEGAELVFHVAANASGTLSVLEPRFDFETNAVGTFNVAEAVLRLGVRRLVYISSASVYGVPRAFPMSEEHPTKPFVPYGASKLAGELTCMSLFHASDLPVVAARPFCVYGPGEDPKLALVEVSRYLRWNLNRVPIQVVGNPDRKTRDFVHVSDVVDALLLIAERAPEGEVFNVGSGTEVSMRQLCDVIGSATDVPADVDEISEITEDTYRLVADISKLRTLGYEPRVPLELGVAKLAADLGESPELPGTTTIFSKRQRGERFTA